MVQLTAEQATELSWTLIHQPLAIALTDNWHHHETGTLAALDDDAIRHTIAAWLAPIDTNAWSRPLPSTDLIRPTALTPAQTDAVARFIHAATAYTPDWRDRLDAYARQLLNDVTDGHAAALLGQWLAHVPTTLTAAA